MRRCVSLRAGAVKFRVVRHFGDTPTVCEAHCLLGGSGGIPPQEIFENCMLRYAILMTFHSNFSINYLLYQGRSKAKNMRGAHACMYWYKRGG